MRAKEFIIVEYRDRLLQYVKSLLPNYPEYVLKDWLVPNKGNFSNLPDTELKNGIMEKLKGAGLTPNTKWQLVPDMKFTMDMFEPMTTKRLIGRAGGNSDMGLDVPRDKERHATQAALAQQQGGVRKEPVLLIKTDKGYELLEGWHRTIQHFAKYPDGYTGPAYVAVAQGQLSLAEGATVTRIDSKPITDFSSSLKAYKHTDDWSQSGLDTGDDSYWKNKNLKTNTTKGLFAGDPRRTALYATGNAHETRYVEFTQNGQPIVYFDQKDLPAMRSRKTYLTVFDASDFRQLPTGEWFSENPSKPIKQVPIGDPFKYIASQGWIVRVTDDLDKVFKQVKNMHKAGKIAQYGAEGMNESKQGVAEDLTEVVDLDTAFPLKWDQQFAAQGEIHAAATDADGREIGISFTPAGNGEITDVAFTRGGTHEMTGRGDAGRVMATVINAINLYTKKYKPPYLAFSAKSGGGRSGAYTAMIRRHAQGYELLPTDKYPAALNNYLEFIGTDQPFVLART
jgi:hypothetical protein